MLAALGLAGALHGLLWLARSEPHLVQRLLNARLYPPIRGLQARASGLLPFSLAEVLIGMGAALCLWALVRTALGLFGGRLGWRRAAAGWLRTALFTCASLYAFYVLAWGFNHARPPLGEQLQLAPAQGGIDGLLGLLVQLRREVAGEVDALAVQADFQLSPGGGDGGQELRRAWVELGERLPLFAGPAAVVRLPLSSPLMSAGGLAGIYSPFTGEAHVNGQLPWTLLPFTAAHEVAHQRGFAREDEANFVAYLVCRASTDPRLRYSGSLQALGHALADYRRRDPGRSDEFLGTLPELARRHLAEQRSFWARHLTPLARITERANDTYLKSQGQAEGTQSYGGMVDLLIRYRGTRFR